MPLTFIEQEGVAEAAQVPNGARQFAISQKRDPASWYDMKKVLPLLARPEYYARLKAGRAAQIPGRNDPLLVTSFQQRARVQRDRLFVREGEVIQLNIVQVLQLDIARHRFEMYRRGFEGKHFAIGTNGVA